MATLTSHPIPHHASFSSSTRAPFTNTTTMADSLPALNFNFDDLRARMSEFTVRFDDFIERGRRKVLEERNLYRMRVADVQEQTATTHRTIHTTTLALQSHIATLASQTSETAEMAATTASLTTARDAHLASVASLRAKLAETQRAVKEAREEQRVYENWLGGMRGEDGREVGVWEGLLGVRVERARDAGDGRIGGGEGDDKLKIVFSGLGLGQGRGHGHSVSRAGKGGEASFVLDVGKVGYDVLSCEPELEREDVEACVARMAEGEDLTAFLKSMRELFVSAGAAGK